MTALGALAVAAGDQTFADLVVPPMPAAQRLAYGMSSRPGRTRARCDAVWRSGSRNKDHVAIQDGSSVTTIYSGTQGDGKNFDPTGPCGTRAGSQAVLVFTDPKYTGPVLLGSKRLDGAGTITFTGPETSLPDRAFGIPQTASPPYWGTWIGSMTPSDPGCYGIQLDGTTFSVQVVIQVKKGPPPPG